MRFFRHLFNSKGEELPDSTPSSLAIKMPPQKSLHEKIVDAIRSDEWRRAMMEQGRETWEEANDFGPEDDLMSDELPDVTPYNDEDGHFHAARQGEVKGMLVDDVEMSEKQADIVRKARDYMNNPKPQGDKNESVPKV